MSDLLIEQPATGLDPAPQPSVGLPLLASWVVLVWVVTAVPTEVDQRAQPRNASHSATASTTLRELQLAYSINASADPCTDAYNYSCGRYGEHNAVDPWRNAAALSARRVRATPMHAACERLPAGAWGFNASGCATAECLWGQVLDGLAVNGVTAAVHSYQGVYHLVVQARGPPEDEDDGSGLHEGECLDGAFLAAADLPTTEHVLLVGPVCARLAESSAVALPEAVPKTCADAVAAFSKAALAGRMAVGPAVAEMAAALQAAAQVRWPQVSPAVLIGGGPGLVADLPFGPLGIADMWARQRREELALVGGVADRARWTAAASEVNAFYDSSVNAVYLPAAITLEPFYAAGWSAELVHGGLGFVVAHELGHAADHALNDTSFVHTLGHLLAQRAATTYAVARRTEHETAADVYGIELLETVAPLTRTSGLQLAQLWCLSPPGFSGDEHAPGGWRVNLTLGVSQGWRASVC